MYNKIHKKNQEKEEVAAYNLLPPTPNFFLY